MKEGDPLNSVGQIVKRKRESIGLSQNQLAKKAGISQASLNALESRTNNPSVETVFLLASAFDCTVSELLGEQREGVLLLTENQRRILDVFDQLNDTGRQLLIQQAELLLSQPSLRQDGSFIRAE